MRWRLLVISGLVCLSIGSPVHAAVMRDHFLARTARDIVQLCTASEDDPMHDAAIAFCHGFLVGVYRAFDAEGSGPKSKRSFCLPEPQPSRKEGIDMFITWAQGHPQRLADNPVDALLRFLDETWPCKK